MSIKLRTKNSPSFRSLWKEWLILLVFFIAMLWIHRYIFLYADDIYYSRDAQYGLDYLPESVRYELNTNGRAWIGVAMFLVLKPQIELFRILNPLLLTLLVYILAKMTTYSESSLDSQKGNPFWIALLCASLFLLFMPLRISHTTLYYAACAFNYVYPMILALLYAHLLYSHSNSSPRSKKLLLLLLAFFVGSSTQQVGMIGIGFTVMISIYLAFFRKKVLFRAFLPFYVVTLLGYTIVTYGSLKRLLWEKNAGNEAVLMDVVSELLKTNIFSTPAAPFVLLISLSCIFWLLAFSGSLSPAKSMNRKQHILNSDLTHSNSPAFIDNGDQGAVKSSTESKNLQQDSNNLQRELNNHQRDSNYLQGVSNNLHRESNPPLKEVLFTRSLAFLLSMALISYIYFLLYKEVNIKLSMENLFTLYGLSILAFVFVYLFAIVYTSVILLKKRNYPFFLFNTINAIGAQIMLIVVDARFAAAYKIMFPSLLLLSVFIFYSFLAFRQNALYLALAFFLITLSFQEKILALGGAVILGLTLFSYLYSIYGGGSKKGTKPLQSESRTKLMQFGFGVLFCLISGAVFSVTLLGYYKTSLPQNYNLQAIRNYHEAEKKGVLLLKKVPPSYYGYNLGNWNTMPDFMRQCYGIKEDTPIKYID